MIKQFTGDTRYLSNFINVKIKLFNIEYPSIEHAYQSAKNDNRLWKKLCADPCNNAGTIKIMGSQIKLKSNWESIKMDIMEECIDQKFNQEPFKSKLMATNEEHIQEGNHWKDTYWGVNLRTGKSHNYLGSLIMIKRTSLKNALP